MFNFIFIYLDMALRALTLQEIDDKIAEAKVDKAQLAKKEELYVTAYTEALKNNASTEFITKQLTALSASMTDLQQKIENLEKERLKLPTAAAGSYLGSRLF